MQFEISTFCWNILCDVNQTTLRHFYYPVWHLVSVWPPVVIVEDHDGGHHGARHHEHDAVEVGPYQRTVGGYRNNLRYCVQKYCQRKQDRHP